MTNEFKISSYCKADEPMCVAVRVDPSAPAVQDTKDPAQGNLELSAAAFRALLTAVGNAS